MPARTVAGAVIAGAEQRIRRVARPVSEDFAARIGNGPQCRVPDTYRY